MSNENIVPSDCGPTTANPTPEEIAAAELERANAKAASDAAKAERRAKLAAIKKTLSDAKQARSKKENPKQ